MRSRRSSEQHAGGYGGKAVNQIENKPCPLAFQDDSTCDAKKKRRSRVVAEDQRPLRAFL